MENLTGQYLVTVPFRRELGDDLEVIGLHPDNSGTSLETRLKKQFVAEVEEASRILDEAGVAYPFAYREEDIRVSVPQNPEHGTITIAGKKYTRTLYTRLEEGGLLKDVFRREDGAYGFIIWSSPLAGNRDTFVPLEPWQTVFSAHTVQTLP